LNLFWVGNGDGFIQEENRIRDLKAAIESDRLITKINRDSQTLFKDDWGELGISAPVKVGDEVVGGLQVVSHITEARDGVLHYNWQLLSLLVVFSLLMVIVISYSLGHEVVNPIREILEATKRVKEGDLDQKIKIKSGNEIGKLAGSFNDMMKELRKKQTKVDRYVKSLKDVNMMLKQAEHHVLRTEKLATIGRLAAGVAHEVGNPLGALYGYLEVLKKRVTGEDEDELIGKIEQETNRINEIIFGLLDLSRQDRGKQGSMKVNELIEKTIALLTSQNALAGIESQLHLNLNLPDLNGDPREFQQALINVLANAIESMPTGGQLTVRTGTTTYRCEEIKEEKDEPVRRENDPENLDFSPLRKRYQKGSVCPIRDGQEVVFVEVSDTGKGIKREYLPRIFEPFFTLKDRDKERGTGLGLAICERIIRGFGGIVHVDSVWGKGSTFMFYLPIEGTIGPSSEKAELEKKNRDHRGES
jgi:signal transduction histidine kinase